MAAWWVLFRTRWGLALRAVGENPAAAFAAGWDPHAVQYRALFVAGDARRPRGRAPVAGRGADMGGVDDGGTGIHRGGARVFSKWHPLRAVAGAVLFGGAISLQLQMQARGVPLSPFLLDMLPYLLSLAVLAGWGGAHRHAAPGSLGRVFQGKQ